MQKDQPQLVLIRDLEPLEDFEKVYAGAIHKICNGPGKLCRRLENNKVNSGMSLTGAENSHEIFIEDTKLAFLKNNAK